MFHDGAMHFCVLNPGSGAVGLPSLDVEILENLRNYIRGYPGLVLITLPPYSIFGTPPSCDSSNYQDCIFVKVSRLHSDSGGTDYLQLSYGDLPGHYTWLLQLFVLLAVALFSPRIDGTSSLDSSRLAGNIRIPERRAEHIRQ